MKTLNERREFKLMKYMSKIIEREGPEEASNIFEGCNIKNYYLRSNCILLRLSKLSTNAMKRSFSYKGAKAWNHKNKSFVAGIMERTYVLMSSQDCLLFIVLGFLCTCFSVL